MNERRDRPKNSLNPPARQPGILSSARLLPVAVAGLVACATAPDDRLADLDAARSRWAAQGLAQYAITVERLCFCAGPHRVEVRVGEVAVTRTDLETGEPVPPELAAFFPDVPGFFTIIESEIRRPAHRLTASYHPVAGYPESIVVDPIGGAVDDEYSYRITALQPLR